MTGDVEGRTLRHMNVLTQHAPQWGRWRWLVWLVMVLLSWVVIYQLWVQAPRSYTLDLADRTRIQGAYPPEAAGSWLRGDTVVMLPHTYAASLQILEMRWQRFSLAEAFPVTISQQVEDGQPTAVAELVPTTEVRRIHYLLKAPVVAGDTVRLLSSTQQFSGDTRFVGALVRDISIRVLPFETGTLILYIAGFWAVTAALALWMSHGRWLEIGRAHV